MNAGKLAVATLPNAPVAAWSQTMLATISSVLALFMPANAQDMRSAEQLAKDLRDEAARIIRFEATAAISMPDWDRQINVVRAAAALASYQVACASISAITYAGAGSARVICDHGQRIYNEFRWRKSLLYVGIFN